MFIVVFLLTLEVLIFLVFHFVEKNSKKIFESGFDITLYNYDQVRLSQVEKFIKEEYLDKLKKSEFVEIFHEDEMIVVEVDEFAEDRVFDDCFLDVLLKDEYAYRDGYIISPPLTKKVDKNDAFSEKLLLIASIILTAILLISMFNGIWMLSK